MELLDYADWQTTNTVVGDVKIFPDVWSPQLRNKRHIAVYLPPSYARSRRSYPVVYMHDGQNLFDEATSFIGQEWRVDETMEKLSHEGIEAIIVGLWNTKSRAAEYTPFSNGWRSSGDDYAKFVVNTVKPMIDKTFRTKMDRAHTGVMGSSLGALISTYLFFKHSGVFGFLGAMSPAYWPAGGEIYRVVQAARFAPGKIYLDNGTEETSAKRMSDLLVKKGYPLGRDLKHVIEEGGQHNESAWARRLPDALKFLLRELY